ncbi:MAG: nucleotidyltransferase substrate binding protein [Chloroflexi bacterium]|nr:nucleotidyltransferase substrate binding protein [Chloroflexota bacterium]
MPLNLKNLQNAIGSLEQALDVYRALVDQEDRALLMGDSEETLRRVLQSGVIKHFEFTYELSWLSIKRWLELNVSPNSADGVTRRELFRLGAENRLIDDVDRWMDHHSARNDTSHTYRKTTADAVFAAIPAFLQDARRLLHALEARND